MAGYSQTPLAKKLGFKDDFVVALLHAPSDFRTTLGKTPAGVMVVYDLSEAAAYDIILFFATSAAELTKTVPVLAKKLQRAGGLWIGWPKKTSGVPTDVTETVVREIGLKAGLVDNKVCAIDEIWSGLRFVIRVRDRPKAAGK